MAPSQSWLSVGSRGWGQPWPLVTLGLAACSGLLGSCCPGGDLEEGVRVHSHQAGGLLPLVLWQLCPCPSLLCRLSRSTRPASHYPEPSATRHQGGVGG